MQPFVPETPEHSAAAYRSRNEQLQEENKTLRAELILMQHQLVSIVATQESVNTMVAHKIDGIGESIKKMQESMLLAFGRMVGEACTLPDPPAPPNFTSPTPRRVVGQKSPLPMAANTGEVQADPIEED